MRRPARAVPLVAVLLCTCLPGAARSAPGDGTLLAPASPAAAERRVRVQEADTARVDTTVDDTAAADTARADSVPAGREPYFPDALAVADSGYSAVVWRCDRQCLLDHSAHNLLDLLQEEWPGAVPLRGSYFGGPHHLADGLIGPALTEVRVEEMPLPELAGGQLDLARIPLAWLSEVVLVRRAGELEVRLIPNRHRSPDAYSRVTAGTGEPNLSLVRGVFTNGMGDHLAVSTGIDLLDTGGRFAGDNRLDFWGLASWTPGDGSGGAELLWRTQSVSRVPPTPGGEGDDGAEEFDRRDAYLRARGELADGLQLHLSAGRSEWSAAEEEEEGNGRDPAAVDTPPGPRAEAEGATLALQARRPRWFGRASFEAWTGPARPAVAGELSVGLRPGHGVRLDGSLRAGRWRGFSTRSVRAGVRWTPDLGAGLTLHASGARGTRGVPRPWLETADSLRFEEYRGGASASLGPYRLSGVAALQDLGRQLPFSADFDRGVDPIRDAEVVAGQGSVAGPLLPLGAILGADVNPMELDVTVRRTRIRGEASPLYVPRTLVQAQLRFRDEFFQRDLGVAFRFGGRHRSGMTTVDVANGQVTSVPSRTRVGLSLVLRIIDARIWYRSENLSRRLAGNLAGQEFPPIRNSFGIKWEFRN